MERINRETLQEIADALDTVQIEPGEREITVTSPAGNIVLTLHDRETGR